MKVLLFLEGGLVLFSFITYSSPPCTLGCGQSRQLIRSTMKPLKKVQILLDLSQITHRPAKWLLPRKKQFLHLFLAVKEVRPILHCIGERDSAETVSCPVETVKIKKCNFLLGSDRSVITAGSSSLESVKKAPRHWWLPFFANRTKWSDDNNYVTKKKQFFRVSSIPQFINIPLS